MVKIRLDDRNMRLLNTKTLDIHEFLPDDIPRYAILSHRWQKEEVSFKQYTKRHKYPKIKRLKGFTKIEGFCRIARERRMEWAWIDTCCIDSRSSAEVSEAINSMWRWYEDADECYIYLCDVHMEDDNLNVLAQVEISEWFDRGWTLQELIAPYCRVFYSSAWKKIGHILGPSFYLENFDRDDPCGEESLESFAQLISRLSNVPLLCLLRRNVDFYGIGERISWSVGRSTSRPEDVAYSLMGLLGVNMPLFYGEGMEKAFIRLQLELLKKYDDTSLFAWELSRDEFKNSVQGSGGLLAPSPARFDRFHYERSRNDGQWRFALLFPKLSLSPYVMTNQGLHLHVGAYRIQSRKISGCRVVWCVPLSIEGTAIFLDHPVGLNPMNSPVSATRTSLLVWNVFNHNGRVLLEGAGTPISLEEDLDADGSVVYLAEDQRGKLEICQFYVQQRFL